MATETLGSMAAIETEKEHSKEGILAAPISINIIPKPTEFIAKEGVFNLNSKVTIFCPEGNEWLNAVHYFQQKIKTSTGIEFARSNEITRQCIVFQEDKNIHNPEAYSLQVVKNQIFIKSGSAKGAFYAIQTLLQLLPPAIESNELQPNLNPQIPCCSVWDEPRFTWRGMHLDVGRHFFTVDFIKKYIDLMAMHKFNRFHWHLTEDQGWRIEIKKYPKLTQEGAYRDGTIVGKPKGVQEYYDGQKYGGFYSQEEVREVVKYAAERFITVVPEIEMPGHSLAALAAYPELACDKGPFRPAMKWGNFRPIFCPKEETFHFLEDVLTEVIDLFPSEYIHIGGDEVDKSSWEDSGICQELMTKEKLNGELELQSYFIRRIERFLNSKGKKMIGWDEILEGGLSDNATVMSWRGEDGGIEAARAKHDVIMTPENFCYFNFYQHSDKTKEPLAMGKVLSVKKVYSYDPIPEELQPEEAKHVLGAQGNLWTEYIKLPAMAEYMAFPRAIALSEVLWTRQELRIWQEFHPRLKEHLKRLDAKGVNYARHILN